MRLDGTDADSDDLLDAFDVTEAEPDMLFVNPFACQVDPLQWQELQVCIAQGCLCGLVVSLLQILHLKQSHTMCTGRSAVLVLG